MSSYIKSELYRILRNRGTYLFILICSALLVSSNIVLAAVSLSDASFIDTKFSIGNFISYIPFVYILCIMVASMIFNNEYANHTMKNCVSYGLPRGTVYFGKLIVTIIYSLLAFVVITAFHAASAFLLLRNANVNEMGALVEMFAACLPLLLFALAVTNCFSFILESSGAVIGAASGLLLAFPLVCTMLGRKFMIFHVIEKYLPFNIIKSIGVSSEPMHIVLPWEGFTGYSICWIAGILQMIVMVLIGYFIFSRKELK